MTTVWSVHGPHLVILGAWVLVAAVCVFRTRPTRDRCRGRHAWPRRSVWATAAIVGTVVSAAIHLLVIPEHFHESTLYGSFFVVLLVVQTAWVGALYFRPSGAALYVGAVGSLLVVLLWLATRTIGIPAGPAAGEIEDFGPLDVLASAGECIAVVAVLVHAVAVRRSRAAAV